jgi:hypothetical protein
MWICLNDAFFSIVDKAADPKHLMVRARRKGDIERHFPEAKVARTVGSDYLFRAEISRNEVAAVMSRAIKGIDYDNFKNSVREPKLHAAYNSVWGIMSRLQPVAPYARRNTRQRDLL